ncbi:hypothetical protein Lser_V15G05117 [Lactuca serriola]
MIVRYAVPEDSICFYIHEKGQWKRSCPVYLRDLRDGRLALLQDRRKERELKEEAC